MNIFQRGGSSSRSTSADPSQNLLPPGTPAPNFTLPDGERRLHSLEDYRGQPLILVFYPGDWSPVCSDQLALYNEARPIFAEYNAQLLGISVDSVHSHKAFAQERNLDFPLLADFEPKGAVSRQYGAYHAEKGSSNRALFVLDSQGIIRWSYISPREVNPGADGILQALEALRAEGAA